MDYGQDYRRFFPEAEGKVRNVRVKAAKGVYSRPVTTIAVIYPAEGYDWNGIRL